MNKKVIGLMKNELGGKIMIELVAVRPKTYSYLINDCSKHERAKGTKKCVIKRILNLIIIKIVHLIKRQNYNYNKDLKVKRTIYMCNKSIRLP